MAHQVKLEVFEGPLDLLLHLITRQRVDIYDVSIADITDEYLQALAALEDVDLETATSFLIIAATLLELKSLRLLPAREADDEATLHLLEERDVLLARLVECATFREAGHALQVRLEAGAHLHPRQVPLDPPFRDMVPDLILRCGVDDVARAAVRVFFPKPLPELDISHVTPITATVRDALLDMTRLLRAAGTTSFEDLCARAHERIDVVVRFLGLLELYKAGVVELSQHDRFGAIQATWTGEGWSDELLDQVEEYTLVEETR